MDDVSQNEAYSDESSHQGNSEEKPVRIFFAKIERLLSCPRSYFILEVELRNRNLVHVLSEVNKRKECKLAIESELNSMEENKVWGPYVLPVNWIFKRK